MMSTGEKIAKSVFLICAAGSAVIAVSIFGFMIALALPLLKDGSGVSIWINMWSPHEGVYGILPMLCGTLWIALPAAMLSLPLSIGTSFVISGLGDFWVRRVLGTVVRFMTGIPTVIYGFVGVFLLVPIMRQGFGGSGLSALTASMVLAVLICPTMILFFSESLQSVNPKYIQAAKSLGANRVQVLLYIMVPRSLGGMASGFILALGRAIGDTLISLMLAGNSIQMPQSIMEPTRSLTAHIALVKAADFDSFEFRSIFTCGIALYIMTTIAAASVRWLESKREEIS